MNAIPSAPAVGDIYLSCTGCTESNHLKMPQAPLNSGSNTANITGSVSILYPANQPKVTYSAATVVAAIKARFDVKPGAAPFTLSVTATVGSSFADGIAISFDPAAGQFTATVPSPTAAERLGDFSQAGLFVMDFMSNLPFAGNIVPGSRLDPNLSNALQPAPLPNAPASGIHSSYIVTGKCAPGSPFTIDAGNNIDLQKFASYALVSAPAGDLPVTLTLTIDGQVVDVATATYRSLF